MAVIYGVIKTSSYSVANFNSLLSFNDIVKGGIDYKVVKCFDTYSSEPFDYTFSSKDDYESWLSDFVYTIVPSEMITDLTDLVEEVEDLETVTIDVILSTESVTTRNDVTLSLPVYKLSFIVCKLLQWDDGDKDQVQDIIDVWNTNNTAKAIDFTCTFDSIEELEAFKETYS